VLREPCYLMSYQSFCCLLIVMSFILLLKINNLILIKSLCIEDCQLLYFIVTFTAHADCNLAESCGEDDCYISFNVF